MSDTTMAYGFVDAKEEAKEYVGSFPLETQNVEARVFMHAILNYFRELGVPEDEREAIMFACCNARLAEWHEGYESAKRVWQP